MKSWSLTIKEEWNICGCWEFFCNMMVYWWNSSFELGGCYHLALRIMCLCMKKAMFPESEVAKKNPKSQQPADEIIKSAGNVVPGKGLATN